MMKSSLCSMHFKSFVVKSAIQPSARQGARRVLWRPPPFINRTSRLSSTFLDKGTVNWTTLRKGISRVNKNNRRCLSTLFDKDPVDYAKLMGESLQPPAGRLWDDNDERDSYIPEIKLHEHDGRQRKRVLVLCTGGTLTMAPSDLHGGALAPVEGALSSCMEEMDELQNREQNNMPDYVLHEYAPFYDSSDLGPADWARVAYDIKENYYHFDGFVVITGTDTMAYFATALSFMLENLGKPVVFTGSQIPLSEPYNDGRRNLIMALIFASR